ncbi:FadR/GntR family transcriptional regulator [Brevundimonas sp. NIBR11]|uniref:FadR/GntR family transcriptional regulator n=1 Tax=Brevundimonas sp. NIBR11 TaxID=3015999 RepID=UPI0022F0F085|nr:FadR/GntR family transcriptional regulator [Brevundimonas sp. NIBR11]WGM30589.1 HTH-type transcriptional repressor NanR [Brevundimonas sp. NIBR11]
MPGPKTAEPVGFRAIQTTRLYQQIAEQIKAYIRSGGLKAGDRLPSERDMAVMFAVSRPSVREAMIALEGAGLIEVRTGDGTFITDPAGRPGALKGDEPGVLEQFQARRTLEPALAAMAATLIKPAELALLRDAVDRSEGAFNRGDLADASDYTFHVQLAAFSGNRILAELVRELWDLRASESWRVIRNRATTREHRLEVVARRRAILDALQEKDADLARALMQSLLDAAMNRYFGDIREDAR